VLHTRESVQVVTKGNSPILSCTKIGSSISDYKPTLTAAATKLFRGRSSTVRTTDSGTAHGPLLTAKPLLPSLPVPHCRRSPRTSLPASRKGAR